MDNSVIYKIARQKLLDKRQKVGYVILSTCCWGMVLEFEREWHKQKGGEPKGENLFPEYTRHEQMRSKLEAANLTVPDIIETLNWKYIDYDVENFRTGDIAILTPMINNKLFYAAWFYNENKWEISDESRDGFASMPSERADVARYILRKKEWSEITNGSDQ